MIIYPTCESIPSTFASLEDNPAHGIYCIYPCRSVASQGEVVKFYHGSSQSSSNFVCMLRNCFDLFCYQNQALVKTHSLFADPTFPQERMLQLLPEFAGRYDPRGIHTRDEFIILGFAMNYMHANINICH